MRVTKTDRSVHLENTSATNARLTGGKLRRSVALRSRAVRGDAGAFAELYHRHHQALYRYCRSILRHDEDARDALQSTMAKAFAALQREERDFDLRPWLFRIAHNEAISLLRTRPDVVALDVDDHASRDSLPATVEQRVRVGQLMTDLGQLSERQRAALVLRELNGLSHSEIAAVVGGSPDAVKQTIFEARSAVQECAAGRAMGCAEIQRVLSDGDGRVLRGRRIRAHLRECRGCRQFRSALTHRRTDLALLAPPLPAASGAALLAGLIPGTGASGLAGGSAAALGTSGAAGLTTKVAVVLAAGLTAAGGTVAATHLEPAARVMPPDAAAAASGFAVQSSIGRTAWPHDPPGAVARQPVPGAGGRSRSAGPSSSHPIARDAGRKDTPAQGHAPGAPPAKEASGDARPPHAPPGQTRRDAKPPLPPPGQTRRDAKPPHAPPGQTRQDAKPPHPPPGQTRQNTKPPHPPPGQTRQNTKPPHPPPGQAPHDSQPAVPPANVAPPGNGAPPGQASDHPAPGQDGKSSDPGNPRQNRAGGP